MARSGLVWTVTPEQAFGTGTTAYIAAIRRGVRQIADRRAPEIAEWMKANHPWQNRTGAAEAGLYTAVEELALGMVRIILSHGSDVPYGSYLEGFTPEGVETMQGGRFAVIAPAVDTWGVVIWRDVQNMMR